MKSDKLEAEKSEIILRPQSHVVGRHACLVFIMGLISFYLARSIYQTGLYTKFSWFICVLSLFVAAAAVVGLGYLLYVVFSKNARLIFTNGGIEDRLSPFSFGPIARQDIRKIKVTVHILFGTVLAVDLNPTGPAIQRLGFLSSLCYQIYNIFFDGTIYFPMNWLGVTKHDLESRLMLYRQKVVTDSESSYNSAPKKYPKEEDDGYAEEISAYQEVEITRPAYEKAAKSVERHVDDAEKALLLQKIEQIKQHVAETHLDVILCELYTDEISQWLEWEGHRDWPKPKELRDIKLVDNTINYQEVTFRYKEKHFHFGLRRNVGSSQEALLSVSYEGHLCLALKVRVEIGALTPKKLEQYMQGEWEQELRALYDGIADLRGRRRAGAIDDEEAVTQTDVEIENPDELKRRFGI